MSSKAEVLEQRLLEAGQNLLKLGAIIGEYGLDKNGADIETPAQAEQLIKRYISQLTCKHKKDTQYLDDRTDNLLQYLRAERTNQLQCKELYNSALKKLESQNNFVKCTLQLQCPDYENIMQLRQRSLETGTIRILIAGEICAGKSSILNIVMGGQYLPVGHGPCTMIPCEVQQSRYIKALLHYEHTNYSTREVPLTTDDKDPIWFQLWKCVETGEDSLEKTEQRTTSRLKKLVIHWNMPFLTDSHQTHRKAAELYENTHPDEDTVINGVTFIDVPGIHDTEDTFINMHEYIENSDAFLFIINNSQHTGTDRDRLLRVMADVRKSFEQRHGMFTPTCAMFICNKWDHVDVAQRERLKTEILTNLRNKWSRVREKQMVPFTGSTQTVKDVQQGNFSDEYVLFFYRLCSFVQTAARLKTETNSWWLSVLIDRTLAVVCTMQELVHTPNINQADVQQKLQNDTAAIIHVQERTNEIERKLDGKLAEDMKKIQTHLRKDLVESKGHLSAWHISNIPVCTEWHALDTKIHEAVVKKIEDHIMKDSQIESIRNQTTKSVYTNLNDAIKLYGELEEKLAFPRHIRDNRFRAIVDLMTNTTSELSWQEVAGVVVAVLFPLAPIVMLLIDVFDLIRTPSMLNDEGLFKDDCYDYMRQQTGLHLDYIISHRLQQTSEALLDVPMKNSKFVLKFIKSSLNIQLQIVNELTNELSSKIFKTKDTSQLQQLQQLSKKVQQFMIGEVLNPEVDESIIRFDTGAKDYLGGGSFGRVYKGTYLGDEENMAVAVKVIRWPEGSGNYPDDTYIYRECFIMRRLSVKPESLRANVVEFIGDFVEVCHSVYTLHIVMELCDGSLDSLIQKKKLVLHGCTTSCVEYPGNAEFLDEGAGYVISLAEQATLGVQFLHDNNIIHRDIKPHNFLVKYENGGITRVKICDFGMSRDQKLIISMRGVGTLTYNAPEVLQGGIHTFASDIYSLGLVIWELWYGQRVFSDLTDEQIKNPKRKQPEIKSVQPPDYLRKLLVSMWKRDRERPDVNNIVRILKRLNAQIELLLTGR